MTRYPVEAATREARKRLEAMKQPVPKATPEAFAEDKAEIASRGSLGHVGKVMENFHRGPDVSEATKIGEPTLVDPKQASAPDMVREAAASVSGILQGAGVGNSLTVEKVSPGAAPAANAPVPHSDAAPGAAPTGNTTTAAGDSTNSANGTAPDAGPAGTDMKNDLAPAGNNGPAPAPPPTQVNDLANAPASNSTPPGSSSTNASSSSSQQQTPAADPNTESSSKKKKKHHIIPF
jgi:hypothetical protein